jgi:hypothetical protein
MLEEYYNFLKILEKFIARFPQKTNIIKWNANIQKIMKV